MGIEPESGMSELMAALGGEPQAESEQSDEPQAAYATEATDDQAQEAQEESSEVVELDGKQLAIPKGTPPELVETVQKMAADLKADHTRKTQEAAAQRREADELKNMLDQQRQLLSVGFDKAVELRQAQARVQQFGQIDWATLADSDPGQATKLMAAYQVAQQEAATKQAELQQLMAQQEQQTAAQRKAMLEQARAAVKERIPGLTDAVLKKNIFRDGRNMVVGKQS